jgi:hypothetical protein
MLNVLLGAGNLGPGRGREISYQSADGSCNDLRDGRELVGAAGVAFGRNVDKALSIKMLLKN